MAVYGYARVSKGRYDNNHSVAANLRVERKKLTDAGVDPAMIVDEVVSGTRDREKLTTLLSDTMQAGDTLVVSNLARLSRSVRISEWALSVLDERGLELRSLREGIDTHTISGRLFFRISSAMAQAQVEAIAEDSKRGQEMARATGKHIGRPFVLNKEKEGQIDRLLASGLVKNDVAVAVGISRRTLGRYLNGR